MKLTILTTFILSANLLASTYSQEKKFSFDLKGKTVKEVFNYLEKESKFRFFYNDDFNYINQTVNLSAKNENVQQILQKLFVSSDIAYKVLENNLVVVTLKQSLQQMTVMGIITDAGTGEPLPGVSVAVEGTGTGVVSDLDGKYSIEVPNANAVLTFSYVGYLTERVAVEGKNQIDIKLSADVKSLDEVVVVGFGTQKRVNLTGAVSTVNSKDLEDRPVQNVAQALQGLLPGLNISQNQGMLENTPSINIRGVGTIGAGSVSTPLILIDGIEGDINAINPQDIDNISVLKDAASSSIYGSRAPFGVILVTTKKGKAGKTVVNYTDNFRWNSPILLPKMVDSYTFALYWNDANTNGGNPPYFDAAYLQRIKDFQDGKLIGTNGKPMTVIPNPNNTKYWADGYGYGNDNVDWFKAIYKDVAMSQEHNISVSGGKENLNYYFSGNYLDMGGLMKLGGDNFNRYTVSAKISSQINKWITIDYSGRYIRQDYERPAALTNSLNQDLARQGWPTLPLYDPNGYLYSSPSPALGLRDGGRDRSQTDWNYQQLGITLQPTKGWKIFGNLNYRINDQFRHWDTQYTYNHDVNGNPVMYGSSSSVHEEAFRANFFSPNVYSEYAKDFGGHNIKVMTGFQSELYKYRTLGETRQGVMIPSLPSVDITTGTDVNGKAVTPAVNGSYTHWSTAGFFGRFNYDFKSRYLLEFNLRYDGTSRYRANKQWNWFPSVSAGWNLSKESFWKPLESVINNFKMRASYGELGDQNTQDFYPTYTYVGTGTSNGSWLIGGAQPNTASAPGIVTTTISWERIRTINLGFDFNTLNNRLSGSLDWFTRYTLDMMGPGVELPATLGTDVPKTNNTDLKTKGYEIDVAWRDRFKNGLGYSIHLIFSDAQTEITKYPNPTGRLANNVYRDGMILGEIWGYETIGIAKTNDEMNAYLATLTNGGQNALGTNWRAGDIMYKDLNGDGKIDPGSTTVSDPGDRKIIGNSTPRFPFGVDLAADWKGFDIRAFFQGIMKRDFFQSSYYFFGAHESGIWWSSALTEHMDYFRDDPNSPLGLNLDSYYPRPYFNTGKNHQAQTRYLQNAAYVRLKNLQIGYTVPQNITKKIGIQKLRVFVSGENIWTYTKMAKMFDPESIDGGWNGNVYPLSKVWSCGLNLNF